MLARLLVDARAGQQVRGREQLGDHRSAFCLVVPEDLARVLEGVRVASSVGRTRMPAWMSRPKIAEMRCTSASEASRVWSDCSARPSNSNRTLRAGNTARALSTATTTSRRPGWANTIRAAADGRARGGRRTCLIPTRYDRAGSTVTIASRHRATPIAAMIPNSRNAGNFEDGHDQRTPPPWCSTPRAGDTRLRNARRIASASSCLRR